MPLLELLLLLKLLLSSDSVPLSGLPGGSSTADSLAALMTPGMPIPRMLPIESLRIEMDGCREALSKVPVCGPALRNRLEYSLMDDDRLLRCLFSWSVVVMSCVKDVCGVTGAI